MEIYRSNYSVGKPYANISAPNKRTNLEYWEGSYIFQFGQVNIYAEKDLYSFRLLWNGRIHVKTVLKLKKPVTSRMLAYQAGIFAREITNT